MSKSLELVNKAYQTLKEYNGENSYIIDLKNSIFAYKSSTLNDFQVEFILRNYDKEPKYINKLVKIADWYGEILQKKYEIDFTPQALAIGWYMGDTEKYYVFFCKYRKSQEKAIMLIAPKNSILTNFLLEDYHDIEIDFSDAEKRSNRTVMSHQAEAVKFMLSRKKCILADEMGGGKCEPLSSEIPTPNGFIKMGDINVGDKIFGSDGKKHNVLGVFPQGKKKIYNVVFSDGTSRKCGENHLWIVRKSKEEQWLVKSIKELLESLNEINKNHWEIPICQPVEYEEKEHITLSPYLLGKTIIDECSNTGIPNEYMFDSIDNRIELLRGIMDINGDVDEYNKLLFSTYSEILSKDIKELIYSLGGIANINEKDKLYNIEFQININPFSSKEKVDKYKSNKMGNYSKYICDIKEDGEEDTQCIYVDSEDHSYLTGHDYIVTHNTTSAILAALYGSFKHVLVICPSSVKKTWEKELSLFVDPTEITIVQGSKWDDAKFTIINYDILDNFYTIPTQKIKTKELNVDDNGNVFKEYKEKEIISRSGKIIANAMKDSQLFQAKYDLIIIDEAHKLSNSTSGRFKIISDLIKRSHPNGIFELTGTAITNSSKNLFNLLKLIGVPITNDWQGYMERYCGAKFFYKKNEKNAHTLMYLKSVGKKEWTELTYEQKKHLDEILEKKCKKIMIPGEDSNMDELKEIIKPYYLRRLKSDFADVVSKDIRCLHYEMTEDEKKSYDNLWDEYVALQEDKEKAEKYKKLEEGTLMRQWLADKMISRTISLARKCIDLGHKVVIFCAYDNEIKKFREEFGDIAVYHNGKLTEKRKNKAVENFQNDNNIKVFIGNIISASVGIDLTSADVVIFNNFSFVPADNLQAEDRIHRLNQSKACTVYYQSFNDTYFDRMLEITHKKTEVIDKLIVTEKEK